MGILGRIGQKLKQGTAAALASAVDPRETAVSAQQKHKALLAQVAAAVDDVIAARDRLQAGATAVRGKLPELEEEARRELRAGRRDLARLALQRRQIAMAELRTLESRLAEVQREELALSTVQQRLAAQIDAFAARQEVIRARYSAAEAQVRINEALTGVSADFADLTAALRRAEDQTDALQARATAIDRLVQEGDLESLTATADATAALLPAAQSDLDLELEALEHDIHHQAP